jgi:hypothetical protein
MGVKDIEMQIIDSGEIKRFTNRKRPVPARIVGTDRIIQSISGQL